MLCPSRGLRAEDSSLTASQKSADGIVGPRHVLKAGTAERSRGLWWSGELASGEVLG